MVIDPAFACLITDDSVLPQQTGWEIYSHQLTAIGGTPPYTFAVTAGSILGGLMSASGLIESEFHTPASIPHTSNFTVTVTDSTAGTPITCHKDFSLTIVDATDCPDWSTISWADGTPFFTPSLTTGASFTGATTPGSGGLHPGSIVFNTTGCTTSELHWSWNVDPSGGVAGITITSSLQGILVSRLKNAGESGSEVRLFALQPGNHTITVQLNLSSVGGNSTMSGTILNS